MIEGFTGEPRDDGLGVLGVGFQTAGFFFGIAYPYTTLMEHTFLGKIGTKLFCTFYSSAIVIFAAFRT